MIGTIQGAPLQFVPVWWMKVSSRVVQLMCCESVDTMRCAKRFKIQMGRPARTKSDGQILSMNLTIVVL
jgi:hypothetical protein